MRVTLDNGVQVVLMEYHRAPSLSVTALFRGGSALDAPAKAGVAGLTADLLRKGTDTRNTQQIAEQIDTLGGSLDASAGDDRTQITLDVLSKDANAGLDLFTDIIRHPTLPDEELNRERQLAVSGLQSLGEDPGAIASRVASEVVYAGHPYGQESTITSLKNITGDDLPRLLQAGVPAQQTDPCRRGRFQARRHAGETESAVWRLAEQQDTTLVRRPPVPAQPRKIVLIDKPDATQTQVRWIRPAFARSSPDFFPALLADTVLGGGFTSRLINEIRVNRSLTYGISSSFAPPACGRRVSGLHVYQDRNHQSLAGRHEQCAKAGRRQRLHAARTAKGEKLPVGPVRDLGAVARSPGRAAWQHRLLQSARRLSPVVPAAPARP